MSTHPTHLATRRRRRRPVRSTCLCVVCVFVALALALAASAALDDPGLVTAEAAAQEASPFNYQVSSQVQDGAPAWIEFTAIHSLDSLELEIKPKKGKSMTFSRSNLAGGESVRFEWEHPGGTQSYQLKVSSVAADGTRFGGTQTFEVASFALLELGVDLTVDLKEGALPLEASRPISKVEFEVYGEDKVLIAQETQEFSGENRRETLTWTPSELKPVLVEVKVYDAANSWAGIQVFNFQLPDVLLDFDTNKADIRDDQVHKLDEALALIDETISTYETVAMNMYVAGYTDTVGKPDKNQSLSEKRAKSVSKWFRKNGVRIPIQYAGFGESVLAVSTADEVDQVENRRVLILLTNVPKMGTMPSFPKDNWKRFK